MARTVVGVRQSAWRGAIADWTDVKPSSFGELLRRHRLAAQLTQEALAERCRLSPPAISALERGVRRSPYSSTVHRLADALGLSPVQRQELAASARRRHGPRSRGTPVETPAGRLPIPATPLVGRDADLALARELLDQPEVRLLTVVGTPGVGKSRLGLELATELRPEFRGGVHCVSLAPLSDPAQVAPAIAQAVGMPDADAASLADRLAARIGSRRVLLLLDNFEHLLPAAPLLTSLLQTCPGLHLLVTSRASLRVSGEHRLPLRPLEAADAVTLFVQRARAAAPWFRPGPDSATAVAAVCRRLDGLPLAIELAAPWVRMLSPGALLARLRDRMSLLEGGPRDVPEHHRTLRRTLQWSHDLLEPAERVLFRRLSVFNGAFDVTAAESVCADPDLPAGETLARLSQLVDKSLVAVESGAGHDRYRLLDTVRQYASEQLASAESSSAVERRHAWHFLELAEAGDRAERRSRLVEWTHRLDDCYPDLRAALVWFRAHHIPGWVRITTALGWFWMRHGRLNEGRDCLVAALEAVPAGSPERGPLLFALAHQAYWRGDHAAAEELASESLALAEAAGDVDRAGSTLHLLASIRVSAGDGAGARAAFERGLASAAGDDLRGASLIGMGELLLQEGRVAEAHEVLLRGLELAGRCDDVERVGRACLFLAIVAFLEGDLALSRERIAESLRRYARVAHWNGVASALQGLAALAMADRDPERAMRLTGAAEAIRERIGTPLHSSWQELFSRLVTGPAVVSAGQRAREARAAGACLSVDEAIEYALGEGGAEWRAADGERGG